LAAVQKRKPQIKTITEAKTSAQAQELSAWAELTTGVTEHTIITLKLEDMGGSWGCAKE